MVWPGAIPTDVDILKPQRSTEIALGFLLQAAFGTGTVIDGLAVTQTVTPSMGVLVGPGSIIVSTTVDTVVAGFGSLPVNTAPLSKIGINLTPTTLTTLTAPGTAGQSQNTLVEAQFLEVDGSPVVLPYYNSANPSIPFTGPANAGTPNNTARTNTVQLQYKQGAAAATGSQLTPAPDAGWTGVAVITIANGQSSILNANITRYVNAPIVPTKLPALRIKLTAPLSLYVSSVGNDLNSGLSASVPFATLQAAWNAIINNYDLNGFSVTVNVANGTYTSGLLAQGTPTGLGYGNSVTISGNTTTPSSCTISCTNAVCIQAAGGASISVAGLRLTTSGTVAGTNVPAAALACNALSQVIISGNMTFGAAPTQVWAVGGSIIIASGYTITGGGLTHLDASTSGGFINTGNPGPYAITLTGTPVYTGAFATAQQLGGMQTLSSILSFSGAASGPRYTVSNLSNITTGGAGPNFFPGNVAGTADGSTFGSYS